MTYLSLIFPISYWSSWTSVTSNLKKTKTKKSDINGANKVDLIDLYKKVDKLEEYLVDVLKNQIDLINQQKEILSKIQYSQINDHNESVISSFAAI